MKRTTKANSRGHILHVWDQDDGVWACAAYDHGTGFCRLCHKVEDGTEAVLLEQVFEGLMEVWTEADGSFRFRLTEAGEERAKHLTETNPDAQKFWDDVHISDFERQFDGPNGNGR